MKLWVDDFRAPPDETWTWAKTLDDAFNYYQLHFVEEIAIEEISFDHDLGVLTTLNNPLVEEQTTMPLAKAIEKDAHDGCKPPKWRIHSMNPVGRENLRKALERADRLYEASQTRTNRRSQTGT